MQRIRVVLLITAVFTALLFGALQVQAGSQPTLQDAHTPQQPALDAPPVGITQTQVAWQSIPLPQGLVITDVNTLAIAPGNPHLLLLGTHKGLFRSETMPVSWTQIATETFGSYTAMVEFAPGDAKRLYGLRGLWFVRSDDGGESWTEPDFDSALLCKIVTAASNPQRLYGGSCNWKDNTVPLYRSDDGGQTWIAPATVMTIPISALVVSPLDADFVLGQVDGRPVQSSDGGVTWQALGNDQLPSYAHFAFDPRQPQTIYAGYWNGLLRSRDRGQSWQDSLLHTSFRTFTFSPLPGNDLLGGDTWGWMFKAGEDQWTAQAWQLPEPIGSFWNSKSDGAVYAKGSSRLWRYAPVAQWSPYAVMLPLVAALAPTPLHTPEQAALDRMNWHRSQAGVAPLILHSAIVTATYNHSNYYLINADTPAAWDFGPHGEVSGFPGFTGKWPSDRIKATGYPYVGGAEIIHYLGDPVAAVDGWMATVYHRVIPLDPGDHYTGYGIGVSGGKEIDVMDFGSGPAPAGFWYDATPHPLAYPADGQQEIPTTWNGAENPDPLPPGAARPVGYPFTLQGVGGKLQVDFAELRSSNGQALAIHPSPQDCITFNCFALIPVRPFAPNTLYVVTARGNVEGISFDRRWTFTTGADQINNVAEVENISIGPPWRAEQLEISNRAQNDQ